MPEGNVRLVASLKGHKVNTIFADSGDNPTMDYVGDFEAKYKAEIDPWEQSGKTGIRADYYAFSRARLLSRLRNRFNSEAKGLEIGCGFGYVTELLAEYWQMTGIDVSETALKRAQQLHPGSRYIRADILGDGFALPDKFHFVIISQCYWYLLHAFDRAVAHCISCLEPGGILVLSQAFLKNQKYGLDIANGFEGALRLLMSHKNLRLVECHYDDTGKLCYLDGLILMRLVDETQQAGNELNDPHSASVGADRVQGGPSGST